VKLQLLINDACSSMIRESGKNRVLHRSLFKIPVDFSFRSSLSVTLVSQLALLDRHFFLDFIFH